MRDKVDQLEATIVTQDGQNIEVDDRYKAHPIAEHQQPKNEHNQLKMTRTSTRCAKFGPNAILGTG